VLAALGAKPDPLSGVTSAPSESTPGWRVRCGCICGCIRLAPVRPGSDRASADDLLRQLRGHR
jgi:hypothetical protein